MYVVKMRHRCFISGMFLGHADTFRAQTKATIGVELFFQLAHVTLLP